MKYNRNISSKKLIARMSDGTQIYRGETSDPRVTELFIVTHDYTMTYFENFTFGEVLYYA
jgi:hypothetical protein